MKSNKIKMADYKETQINNNSTLNIPINYLAIQNNVEIIIEIEKSGYEILPIYFKNINLFIIVINIIAFFLFYLCFFPLTNYYYPIYFFYYPMDFLSFIFCLINSVISNIVIFLTILKKIQYFHLLYSLLYYRTIFYMNKNKYMGSSKFIKSNVIFFVYLFLLIQIACIFFFLYHILKKIRNKKYVKNLKYLNLLTKYLFQDEGYNNIDNNYSNEFNNNKLSKIIINLFEFLIPLAILIFSNILLYKSKKKNFTCINWNTSISGKIKLNDENNLGCKLKEPEGYCLMDYYKNYFDISSIIPQNCSIRDAKKEKKYFFKNLNENKNISPNTKRFAFPYTNLDEKFSLKNQKTINDFGKLVNNDIYDLDNIKNKNTNFIYPETILDFSENNIYKGKYGELLINLQYNEKLSIERKKLENNNLLLKNILMIYTDATSRAHFQRSFPKVTSFLKQFFDNKNNKMKAFQFMKYHSFAAYTPINILPMFYGDSKKNKKGINHIKFFKKNGFITGHTVDMCNKEQYDIEHDKEKNDMREYIEWDHENVAFLCDGNYFEIKNPYPGNRGAFSNEERCLYGHTVNFYMFNYLKQFWEKYFNNKKYFRIAFNYGHEKTGKVLSYLDEPLYNFLIDFYNKNYFENTAILFVGDHGNQNDGIYNVINFSYFNLEKKFSNFILLFNGNIEYKYINNLEFNQNVLVTPYDIHDTMIHMIYGESEENLSMVYSFNKKGNSVFKYIEPMERRCEKYDDWDDIKFCSCYF